MSVPFTTLVPVNRPDPAGSTGCADVPGTPVAAAEPATGSLSLPDADEGDAHRPGDSVGVRPLVPAALAARLRTAA